MELADPVAIPYVASRDGDILVQPAFLRLPAMEGMSFSP